MSQIAITVPETLRHQLETMSRKEGVSLEQYVVFALTRHATLASLIRNAREEDPESQLKEFKARRERLGKTSREELAEILGERELVEPESDLNPEIVSQLKKRIADSNKRY